MEKNIRVPVKYKYWYQYLVLQEFFPFGFKVIKYSLYNFPTSWSVFLWRYKYVVAVLSKTTSNSVRRNRFAEYWYLNQVCTDGHNRTNGLLAHVSKKKRWEERPRTNENVQVQVPRAELMRLDKNRNIVIFLFCLFFF